MANALVSKVELTLSCRNLIDSDIFSKSDPMVVLFIKHGTNKFEEFGRTETISNNLNPDFSKSFILDYYFEEIQRLKFQVYDIDSRSTRLDEHDFLGEYECNLGELVSRANVVAKLTGQVTKGTICIRCTEIGSCKELFNFKFAGHSLDKKDFFGKSDPFLEILKSQQPVQYTGEQNANYSGVQFSLAHRTEYIKCNLNPVWCPFQIRSWRLCEGDKDRLLRIDCFDWNRDGSNVNDYSSRDFIGCFYTSVTELSSNIGVHGAFKLINPKKVKNKKYQDSGKITLLLFSTETDYTFVDYISGHTQLKFTVAVDFTASNGPQNDPRSLHYVNRSRFGDKQLNQYEQAICAVGRVLQDYNYDKMFSALGFGARIPPTMQVSHCFPLTFQTENPFCYEVDGLLQAYQNVVQQVQLYGPTNFSPAIRHMQSFANSYTDGSYYFVLLIITDGIITDMDKTVDAIVDSSFLPMSIIIVGVGNEDFSAMNMLDCDNGLLRSGMKIAERDIVQFVPFRDYQKSNNTVSNQASLARAVLAELPDQVVKWMRKHGIKPKQSSEQSRPVPLASGLVGGDAPMPHAPLSCAAMYQPMEAPSIPVKSQPHQSVQYPPYQMMAQASQEFSSYSSSPLSHGYPPYGAASPVPSELSYYPNYQYQNPRQSYPSQPPPPYQS